MKIRKCKNGSFFVKREPEHDTPLNDADFGNALNLVFDLANSAELDFTIAGDEGCADNFHMYYPLYNYYTGLLYLPTDYECADYIAGRTVWLPGRKMNADDLRALLDCGVLDENSVLYCDVWQLGCWYGPETGWVENDRFRLGSVLLENEPQQVAQLCSMLHAQLDINLHARRFRIAEETENSFELQYRSNGKPFLLLEQKEMRGFTDENEPKR